MPANRAIGFLHHRATRNMDETRRLDLEVELGYPEALEARSKQRRQLMAEMGIEVR